MLYEVITKYVYYKSINKNGEQQGKMERNIKIDAITLKKIFV